MNDFTSRSLLLAVALLTAISCSRQAEPPVELPADPIADLPSQLDLGEHELGDVAVATFTTKNRGGRELVLDQFRSNCSCSGLEHKQGDAFVRLETLRLGPGEQAELRMRVSVRGVPVGARSVNTVAFNTNDPARPTGQIHAVVSRVTGGVFTYPETVVVGTVKVGSKASYVIEVRDDALKPRLLDRVVSSHPDRISVRVLKGRPSSAPGGPRTGASIAFLEVTVNTNTPGAFRGELTLQLAGGERTPDVVKVIGMVQDTIELSPQTLVFPRSSPDGPIYSARVLIRSAEGNLESVTLEECPPYLTVSPLPLKNSDSPIVALTVVLDPKLAAECDPKKTNQPVRLRCRANGAELIKDIKIVYQELGR